LLVLQGWISTALSSTLRAGTEPRRVYLGLLKQHELPNVCPKDYWQTEAKPRDELYVAWRRPSATDQPPSGSNLLYWPE